MRKRAQPRRTGGFSLLELMIAMVVIAFTLFGVISMIIHTMTIRQVARENQVASEWVLRRIEEVKSQTFATLNTTGIYPANVTTGGVTQFQCTFGYQWSPPKGTNTGGIPNAVDIGTPASLSSATGSAVGKLTIDYTNANLYEIVCTLTWKGVRGQQTYTMRSLYSK